MMLIAGLLVPIACAVVLAPFSSRAEDARSVDLRFMETMMEDWNMKERPSDLVAVTADSAIKHIGMLFRDGTEFRVYLNGKLINEQTVKSPVASNFFRMTEDGHLLYHLDPTDLYFDGKRISGASNEYSYDIGIEPEDMYRAGRVVFTEDSAIRKYDVRRGRSSVLLTHKGKIAFSRVVGSKTYHVGFDEAPLPGYYPYVNGKKLLYETVDGPGNFHVAPDGTAHYLHQASGPNCVLYRGEKAISSHSGVCGFLYVDDEEHVYHAIATRDSAAPAGFRVRLYENGKPRSSQRLYNIERRMGFGENGAFAVRVRTSAKEENAYKLLKNGRLIGESFDFSHARDPFGVQFGPDGKTYMRNFVKGRWMMYEDGKKAFADTFGQVLFFSASPEKVTVIGTRPLVR